MDGATSGPKTIVDPEGLLRSALEKIVFFECRVSQLESELGAARTTAERARGDAAAAHRRAVELEQAIAVEKGSRGSAERRAGELEERVRLLEAERERLLSGLVDRARLSGTPGEDGGPAPEEGGADLAGFIAELRAEIDALRAFRAAAEAAGFRAGEPFPPTGAVALAAAAADARTPAAEAKGGPRGLAAGTLSALASRFDEAGRVGISARDTDRMKDLLATRADRALYERSMDDLSAPDAGRRLRAVRALEALGSKAAAPLLAAALGREDDPGVKSALLGALARFREPFAADLAIRALEDRRPAVRVAALEALAVVAAEAAADRLAAALSDESPLVRRRAALLLGFQAGERAEDALAVALADADRGVARAAAAALSGRPSVRAQEALARGLEHSDASVRRAAAASLSRLSGEALEPEAPPSARRAASRRISERLAAMDGEEIRAAVLRGAPDAREAGPQGAVATATSAHRGPEAPGAPRASPAPAARIAPAAQAAVAVTVAEAPSPGEAARGDLAPRIVVELRAALRGCTAEGLAAALGAPLARIEAALEPLAAAGAVVRRGTRWFMS